YTLDPRFGNLVRTAIRLGFEVGGYDLFERDFDRREEYQAATLAESGVSMGRSVLMRTSNRRPFEFRTNGLQLSGSRSRKSELQGSLLFEDTKFGEEFSDLGSVATNCLGDIGRAGGPEEANGRISDSGHYFRTGTLSDPACILPESDVTHVMGTILD
ncbi:MAG TPA: hypothetical protein VK395_08885, partial [Gemmataceae bacterium]|nr:hypothetical protein [Gemmataceae bacterium]